MVTKQMKDKRFYEKWSKYQKLLIAVLIIYTFISFIRLGNIESPNTFYNLKNGDYVVYEFEDEVVPAEIVFFAGNDDVYLSTYLAEEYTSNNDTFEYDTSVTSDYAAVYTWRREAINSNRKTCRYVMVSSYWDNTVVGEIAFLDPYGSVLNTKLVTGTKFLNDEPEKIHTKQTYMNSTYFDEVYFPRAAYEMFHHQYIFEYTHPPLGKIIMWIPMAIFGISPFSTRLMGNIAGILMILVMYLIAKELFKNEKYALLAAIILALDGMHFVQTRIATVDSFLILFSMLSILFFIRYLKTNDNKKYRNLAISGLAWGCAVATKWLSCYLGAGLAIIFFFNYFFREKVIVDKKWNVRPILMGLLCFVVIPVAVYLLSYIPVYGNENEVAVYDVKDEEGNITSETVRPNTIKGFLLYQYAMYQYHSNINTRADYVEHPYASKWYTWPIMYRPMWFYTASFEDNMRSTIASMGNPAIWWLSILTFVLMVGYAVIKRDKVGLFLLVLICSTWLAYAIVPREMYIYHYFLTSILMMLTIVYVVSKLVEWKPQLGWLVPTLASIFLIIFIYFYPIYSGAVVSEKYIESTKWLSSWDY